METFIDRLKFIIEEVYRGKQAAFAKDLGISPSMVTRWLQGQEVNYNRLTDNNNIPYNTSWLITGDGDTFKTTRGIKDSTVSYLATQPADIYIKLASVYANAGKSYNVNDAPEDLIVVSRKFNPQRNIAFKIQGDSMMPRIHPGDTIIIDTEQKPVNNDIVICTCGNELLCKRFVEKEDQKYLYSDNPNYSPILINGFNNCTIHGVMVQGLY